jgi:hypothetical protein
LARNTYTLNSPTIWNLGNILEQVHEKKDTGVIIDDDLKFDKSEKGSLHICTNQENLQTSKERTFITT